MRIFLFLSTAALLTAAQSDFPGHWVAMFKGKEICVLEIDDVGGKIAGASQFCHISVDQNGDLLDADVPAEGDQQPSPFINPKVDGATLRYEQSDGDGERIKFELTLAGAGKADCG